MSNIQSAFANGKAFIPFITCGDPDLETTEQVVRAAAQAGADWSVRDNMLLSTIDHFARWGVLRDRAENQAMEQQIDSLQIKLVGPEQRTLELSGGNKQKAIFARALMTQPKVLLCDEPTQAVDVATRSEIHRLLRENADEGSAVFYVSSDLSELLEVTFEHVKWR